MRFRRIVIGAAVVAGTFTPAAALAQTTDPYSRDTPAVLGEQFETRPAVASTGAQVKAGSLAVTGGDIVGLTIIGAGAIGVGTLLVRRTRRAPQPA